MAERLLHEIWFRPGLDDRLKTFETTNDRLSVMADKNTKVIFSTDDEIPSHAELITIHFEGGQMGWQKSETTSFENLFTLFQASLEKDPKNPLTGVLKNRVLSEIDEIIKENNRQMDSVRILKKNIEYQYSKSAS